MLLLLVAAAGKVQMAVLLLLSIQLIHQIQYLLLVVDVVVDFMRVLEHQIQL